MFEIAVAAKSLLSDGLNGTIDDWELKPLLLTALNELAELIDPFSERSFEERPIELKFEVDDDLAASRLELESYLLVAGDCCTLGLGLFELTLVMAILA
jgi:hypothetical protein